MLRSRFEIREDRLLAIVMNLRVANVALFVFENGSDLARFDVENSQATAFAQRERVSVDVTRIVSKRGVPVPVETGFMNRKENLFNVVHVSARLELGLERVFHFNLSWGNV